MGELPESMRYLQGGDSGSLYESSKSRIFSAVIIFILTMVCCTVLKCCFGFNDLRGGAQKWAVVDIVVQFIIIIISAFALSKGAFVGLLLSGLAAIAADAALIFAAHQYKHPLILLIWQIVMLIHIVVMYIYFLACVIILGMWQNTCSSSFTTELSCLYYNFKALSALTVFLVFTATANIYFWVVVHSLRREMIEHEAGVRDQANAANARNGHSVSVANNGYHHHVPPSP